MTLDWSKNSKGRDHGALFQVIDRKRLRSDQINYENQTDDDDILALSEMAFARSLRDILPRLELLGFTLERVKKEYASVVDECREEDQSDIDDEDAKPARDFMSFSEFCTFVRKHPVEALSDSFIGRDDNGEVKIMGRFSDETEKRRLPHSWMHDQTAYSERSYFGSLVNILHPYSILRILGENERNQEAAIVWQYGPLVENGWAQAEEFVPNARRHQTFLVATEGSSDAHILKHAFSLIRPEIEDFFRFIDVKERHPFPGTGNLVKFAEGLAKIDVHNQIVFLLDNDAEGFDAYQRIKTLSLPSNMRAIMLPELDLFRAFPARGPEGTENADINRRAAAIECYLDHNLGGHPPPKVVWTNYKRDLDCYHGSLENKEAYVKEFLRQRSPAVANGAYDVSKMRVVLDSLIAECSTIAMTIWSDTT
jgi:hypothetical protein